MEVDDLRFSLSADKYLERHNVLVYIQDAVTQLLDHREENVKINTSKFFSDYFNSVREGNHVLFREYAYVKATRHNRASFVRMFWKCFKHIGRKGDLLSIKEYHALVGLLCPDFPFGPIQKTARIILMDDALDCLISFSDFLYAFQIQFCFDDFLTKCAECYQVQVEAPPQSPHTTVVVPTSENAVSATQLHEAPNGGATGTASTDGVDSMQFYRALVPICERLDLHAPPIDVLKEILLAVKRVTFFGFLIALAKSETLNSSIGKLPQKSELLDISEQENATPPLRPTSSKNRPRSAQSSPAAGGNAAQSAIEVSTSTDQKAVRGSRSQPTTSVTTTTTAVTTTTSVTTASVTSAATTSLNSDTTSQKTLTSRGKPPPRRTRRTVVISDDDDEDDDDDDDDDSGSTTN